MLVDLLPFEIAFDGPSSTKTFFHPEHIDRVGAIGMEKEEEQYDGGMAAQEHAHWQAAFRGRRIVGTEVALPASYVGQVMSGAEEICSTEEVVVEEEASLGGDGRSLSEGHPRQRTTVTAASRSINTYSLESSDESSDDGQDADDERRAGLEQEGPVVRFDGDTLSKDGAQETPLATPSVATPLGQGSNTSDQVMEEVTEIQSTGAEATEKKVRKTIEVERRKQVSHCLGTFSSVIVWHPDVALDTGADPYYRGLQDIPLIADMVACHARIVSPSFHVISRLDTFMRLSTCGPPPIQRPK